MPKYPTTFIDRHIGNTIRELRTSHCQSQQQLADHLGVSYQQVQKYEHGKNRVAATQLWQLSAFYNVPLRRFFP